MTKPVDLLTRPIKQLTYSSQVDATTNQAHRLSLMGRAAQTKFEHIYTTEGVAASRNAFDAHLAYQEAVKTHPNPLREFPPVTNRLLVIERPSQIPDKLAATSSTHAIIDFMYQWCLLKAGNRARNFQEMYRSDSITLPPTISAAEVRAKTEAYRFSLSLHARYLPPLLCSVADELIIHSESPETGLPFNISIPH